MLPYSVKCLILRDGFEFFHSWDEDLERHPDGVYGWSYIVKPILVPCQGGHLDFFSIPDNVALFAKAVGDPMDEQDGIVQKGSALRSMRKRAAAAATGLSGFFSRKNSKNSNHARHL